MLLVVILIESKFFNVGSNHLSFNIILHVNCETRDHWFIFLNQVPKHIFPTTMTSLILFDIWCLSTKGIWRSILISFLKKILWTWLYSQTIKVIFFGLMVDSWKIMSNDLVRIWFSAILWVIDGPTRRGDTTQRVMWFVMVQGL